MDNTYKAVFIDGPMMGEIQKVERSGVFGNTVVPDLKVKDPFTGIELSYTHTGDVVSEYYPFNVTPHVVTEATYKFVENNQEEIYVAPLSANY